MAKSYIRLVDVCLVVKDLFRAVKEEHVFPVPIASITSVIDNQISLSSGKRFRVEVICKGWEANQLSGALFRYTDHADIIFSNSLNTCWSRFVVCKELAHLLLDTESKHFTKNPVGLVQELISQFPGLTFDDDIHSEHVAMAAAIEMLLPWEFRPVMEGMMKQKLSDRQIAVAFRAPEKIVNLILRSPYGETSKKANSAHPSKG